MPHIRHSSPVAGLGRARLSFAQVLAQSVAAVAPSAVMVTLPALLIPEVGRTALVLFLVAAVLMTLVGYCAGQFAARMVAVSGLYSYSVKGIGPLAGFGAGWSVLIGYGAAAMASVLGAASYLAALLGRIGMPVNTVTIAAIMVIVGALTLGFMVRGVQFTARIVLVIEVFAIVAASAVLVVAYVQADGGSAPGPPPVEAAGNTSALVAFALLLAITSFVGFESAGTVAREARKPFISVPRAIRWTPLAVGGLYVFAASMQMSDTVREGVESLPIVLTLPDTGARGSTALSVLMELGITASWIACVIGSTTALSRTLFAMGREGAVPTVIGRAHPRFHTPHAALIAAMPLIVAVPLVYLVIAGSSRDVLIGLLAVSAHGYVVAYILVCLATPAFLRRIGELTAAPLVIGLFTAASLIALIAWAAAAQTYVAGTATLVYLAVMLAGAAVFAVRARQVPGLTARLGVYDETIAADILSRYQPWAVRK